MRGSSVNSCDQFPVVAMYVYTRIPKLMFLSVWKLLLSFFGQKLKPNMVVTGDTLAPLWHIQASVGILSAADSPINHISTGY